MYDFPSAVPSQLLSPRTRYDGDGSGPPTGIGERIGGAPLRALVEHAFDGLWLLAADGIIRHASVGGGVSVGSNGNHEGRPASDLLHPDDLVHWNALLAIVGDGAGRQRLAEFRLSRDGNWQRAEARVRNLLAHPEIAALVVDWRWIDECSAVTAAGTVELEGCTAQRAADLAAVNRELEAFSYSVSHDLRAPLRWIDGFSRILLEDCRAGLDDRGLYCVERIHAGAQRMNELIDSLLDLSGVTRVRMSRQVVDLSALAETILGELQERAPERVVHLTVAPGVTGNGDPRLLRILMENLLVNAWKYTARRDTAHIEFGVTHDEGRPVYHVRDDGAGFDMSQAQRLFGAFQRLHASEEFDGTGIGLATVQRIVHRHGGRVWGEGAVDCGAAFRFTLGA